MKRPQDDPLVVSTAGLAAIVNRWIEEHRADHPTKRPGMSLADDIQYGAIQWLVERSGVAERSIGRLRTGEGENTAFDIADRLLSAIGRTDLLHVELQPYPRPSRRKPGLFAPRVCFRGHTFTTSQCYECRRYREEVRTGVAKPRRGTIPSPSPSLP